MVYQNRKKLKLNTIVLPVIFSLFFIIVLASCQSSPSAPTPEQFYRGRSEFALLPEGGELYITAKVQSARSILDSLMLGGLSGADLKSFLDMSDTLTAAVFPPTEEWRYYAAATGRFPGTTSGLFFSTSRDWERKISASGMQYWYSRQSQLGLYLSSRLAFVSHDDPFVAPPGAKAPEALSSLQENAVLSGWITNPAQAINNIIAALDLPIEMPVESLVFAVYPELSGRSTNRNNEELYSAVLRFETPSSIQAGALVIMLNLARMGLDLSGSIEQDGSEMGIQMDIQTLVKIFFSNPPRQEGNALILTTGIVNGSELALLFNAFSVY